MKHLKTFESYSINEEYKLLPLVHKYLINKDKLKKGVELWEELGNDPKVKQEIEKSISKLSSKEKEDLKKPGLLKRILDFFNTDDADNLFYNSSKNKLVTESSDSLFMKALKAIGHFLKEYGIGIATLTLIFGGISTFIAGAMQGQPLIVALGFIIAALSSVINKIGGDSY